MRRKKILAIVAGLFLFQSLAQAEVLGVYQARTGTGWLEKTEQGDLVLHLQGSY